MVQSGFNRLSVGTRTRLLKNKEIDWRVYCLVRLGLMSGVRNYECCRNCWTVCKQDISGRVSSSGLWRYIKLDPEQEDTTILRNAGSYSPKWHIITCKKAWIYSSTGMIACDFTRHFFSKWIFLQYSRKTQHQTVESHLGFTTDWSCNERLNQRKLHLICCYSSVI